MTYSWAPLPDGLNPAARQLVEELRLLKDTHGLTFAQMGRLTHYSRASWERWLNGKRPITEEALDGLVAALGTDGAHLRRLLAGADDPAQPHVPRQDPRQDPTGARPLSSGIAQLPSVVFDFTGRVQQIRRLAGLLLAAPGPGQVPIVVVTGSGGLGKTTLAVRSAHLVARHFPDGQLYADARGASEAPRGAQDVLTGWLRALGDDPGATPPGIEEMAARFRSLLAGKRFLLVVDDARDAAQIRPLLPGSAGCAVVVTSRNRLAGLAGATVEHLDVLPADEARTLFATVVGAHRVRAEPQAAESILAACAGLPLAVRIAASRLASRPEWTLAHLARNLSDEAHRLDALQVEDIAVRSVFRMSYAYLADSPGGLRPAQAFRLLGLFPTSEIALPAAAALFGTSIDRSRNALENLVDVNLLATPAPDQYRMHDLLHTFALEQAQREVDPVEHQLAARRLVAWYVHTTERAMDLISPMRSHFPVDTVPEHGPGISFDGYEQALQWCDTERLNLAAVIRLADALGYSTEAWLLPAALLHYYNLGRRLPDWTEAYGIGLRNARRANARRGEAWMLGGLSTAHRVQGDQETALTYSRQALDIARSMDDTAGEAGFVSSIASILLLMGRAEEAVTQYEHALELRRCSGNASGVVATLNNLGNALSSIGRHRSAMDRYHEALEVCRQHPMPSIEAAVLDGLGTASAALGEPDVAVRALTRAVAIRTELAATATLYESLENLAEVFEAQGRHDEARTCRDRAARLKAELRI